MTIDWNRGNGDSVIVLARQGGAVNANPVNGTDYTADAAFGSGSQIGSGNYVVYKGTGTSVTVTGLIANTAYHFALYEYDGNNGDPCYNTTSPLTGNATTDPLPALHYRSKATGNWNAASTWEVSANNTDWTDATVSPNSTDLSITILNGHTITTNSAVTADQIVVKSGGVLSVNNNLTVNNGADDDILVESGGEVLFSTNNSRPAFSSNATLRVLTGGKIKVPTTTNIHNIQTNSYIYGNSSILEYTNNNAFSASGVTYFPNAASDVPVFLLTSSPNSVGGGSATTINGLFELDGNASISWNGNGLKIFRNGIKGNGTNSMTRSADNGIWQITGSPAVLGSSGSLSLTNSNGIQLTSSSITELTSDVTMGTGTHFQVAGKLFTEGYNLLGAGSFTLNNGAELYITSPDGITTTGSSGNVQVSGSRTYAPDARYIYSGSAAQSSGNGLPSPLTSGGGLQVQGSTNLSLTHPVTLSNGTTNSIASGATLTVASGVVLTNNASITGTGAVTNNGTILGTGSFGGNLVNNAVVQPGNSAGTLSLSGAYTSNGTSELDIELGGTSSGHFDVLAITGSAELNGTLNLSLINAFEPLAGNKFVILTAGGGVSSTFSTVNYPVGFENFMITYNSNNVELEFMGPLPVELTRFEAQPQAEGVALRWETASEQNNELFEVQHSPDGRQFRVLGEVPGAGTTLLAMQYDYLHKSPQAGSNYYRLRQVDYDGRYEYSPVRVVEWGGAAGSAGDWSLRPTVTSDLIHLIRREVRGEGRWAVLSPSGRLVREGSIGADTDVLPIDVATLPPGIWLLQVRTRQGVWTERFQKI